MVLRPARSRGMVSDGVDGLGVVGCGLVQVMKESRQTSNGIVVMRRKRNSSGLMYDTAENSSHAKAGCDGRATRLECLEGDWRSGPW